MKVGWGILFQAQWAFHTLVYQIVEYHLHIPTTLPRITVIRSMQLTLEEKPPIGSPCLLEELSEVESLAVVHHLALEGVERVVGNVRQGCRYTAHAEIAHKASEKGLRLEGYIVFRHVGDCRSRGAN